MPSTTVFDRQPHAYRQSVLPAALPCVAIEAGAADLWRKYVGRSGAVVGLDRFGESAPAGDLFRHFGFTRERAVDAVMQVLS
jgi:transketolase